MPINPGLEHARAKAMGATDAEAGEIRRIAEDARERSSDLDFDPYLERTKAKIFGASDQAAGDVLRAAEHAASTQRAEQRFRSREAARLERQNQQDLERKRRLQTSHVASRRSGHQEGGTQSGAGGGALIAGALLVCFWLLRKSYEILILRRIYFRESLFRIPSAADHIAFVVQSVVVLPITGVLLGCVVYGISGIYVDSLETESVRNLGLIAFGGIVFAATSWSALGGVLGLLNRSEWSVHTVLVSCLLAVPSMLWLESAILPTEQSGSLLKLQDVPPEFLSLRQQRALQKTLEKHAAAGLHFRLAVEEFVDPSARTRRIAEIREGFDDSELRGVSVSFAMDKKSGSATWLALPFPESGLQDELLHCVRMSNSEPPPERLLASVSCFRLIYPKYDSRRSSKAPQNKPAADSAEVSTRVAGVASQVANPIGEPLTPNSEIPVSRAPSSPAATTSAGGTTRDSIEGVSVPMAQPPSANRVGSPDAPSQVVQQPDLPARTGYVSDPSSAIADLDAAVIEGRLRALEREGVNFLVLVVDRVVDEPMDGYAVKVASQWSRVAAKRIDILVVIERERGRIRLVVEQGFTRHVPPAVATELAANVYSPRARTAGIGAGLIALLDELESLVEVSKAGRGLSEKVKI